MPRVIHGIEWLPQATFRRRLRHHTAAHRGALADAVAREQSARDERRLGLDPLPDGIARMHLTGPTEQVAAAARRVDTLARSARTDGDPTPGPGRHPPPTRPSEQRSALVNSTGPLAGRGLP